MPALIKSYIKLGGKVGLDAYVDHKFNTTDVCLIMDTSLVDPKRKSFLPKETFIDYNLDK